MRIEEALPAFVLVLARVGGALLIVPLPGLRQGAAAARAALAVTLTVALMPVWPAAAGGAGSQLWAWLPAEAAFGITVGAAVTLLNEMLVVAAQILGFAAGLSFASVFDPASEADSAAPLVLAQLAGGLLFFSLGLHRQVLRVFAASFDAFPPGAYQVTGSLAQAVIQLGAGMIGTGLKLALPVLTLLLLTDIALGLLGRTQVQLSLLGPAWSLRAWLTLGLLVVVLGSCIPAYKSAASRTLSALTELMAQHAR